MALRSFGSIVAPLAAQMRVVADDLERYAEAVPCPKDAALLASANFQLAAAGVKAATALACCTEGKLSEMEVNANMGIAQRFERMAEAYSLEAK